MLKTMYFRTPYALYECEMGVLAGRPGTQFNYIHVVNFALLYFKTDERSYVVQSVASCSSWIHVQKSMFFIWHHLKNMGVT